MQEKTDKNINFYNNQEMITPAELKSRFPLKEKESRFVCDSQQIIANIIHGKDSRLLIVCGPCSIHDVDSTIDYAHRLKVLSDELSDKLYIVMRVYLEKPRTVLGWKGLINDPHMDGSFDIKSGLEISRSLLLKLLTMGLPLANEALDLNTPQYLGELFSWSAIGARTTESQVHRELASALPMSIGFKNSTSGNLMSAINAIRAASISHCFMGINQSGRICLLKTQGNLNGHVILRGGIKPNYYPEDIAYCESQLLKVGLPLFLMVDCSHGNSNKNYHDQIKVARSILDQIKDGNRSIVGLMLESHIYSGNQVLQLPYVKLRYGVSVTDACIDWISTENLLRQLHMELNSILSNRLVGAMNT
ncbi:3-deoxy-7-phosphoheptulonate synthase [Blochmannia endosymbiont of Camponotus (Colobopsis) obliquus]|uniref:3-deoxy-7-phosphoheptulonate synthase n=1 Tax=Blochmannia endosymbiont of Camponotus (Colobopsis) obliquus TaxID=1505597 RepID=UPI00061A6A88|nr:3-deoxy-7-phosphoheptulonate synthase [Blochmannia endosymbiont of Camponotus (Colobopsis) obliquus]AKC60351.1 Phospho-2-dehydro-3-deoxyheptonate aldolase, Tyr-sensitive [Blochmannia endosymbiont of Camponotus (Colobopsis) obliquus]